MQYFQSACDYRIVSSKNSDFGISMGRDRRYVSSLTFRRSERYMKDWKMCRTDIVNQFQTHHKNML
jgi:hypothetical protein